MPWLPGVFPYVERFAVLWDVADLPGPTFPRMAEVLARNEHLSLERWDGFHLCNHPARLPQDAENRWAVWRRLLAVFPVLATAGKAA